MFEYTVEELIEQLTKTIELNGQSSKSQKDQHTVQLGHFLQDIKNSVEKNKSVNVENIAREITKPIDMKRPSWLNELKKDDSKLIQELVRISKAIETKEVVKEVDIKKSSWLKAALRKNTPKDRDYSKLLEKILKSVSKEVKYPTKMDVTGKVEVQNNLSVKKPLWYNPSNYSDILNSILKTLKAPLSVVVENPVAFDKNADVKVKNPVEIKGKTEVVIKDGQGRIIDFDKQFGRMSGGGSSGAIDTSSMEANQVEMIEAINNVSGISTYNYIQREAGSSYKYYGFASDTGWQLKRKELATGIWLIDEGTGDYNTAWADRANKTYDLT